MTPDARAQVAREVLTELAEAMGAEGNGGGGRVLRFRDEQFPPPSPVPPPIPLGAVVTVTVNGVEWQREDGEWDDAEGGGPPNKADALEFLDRIAELEREVHLARNDEALALSTSREWESYCKRAERERDEARRELAAQKETANSLISENAAEKENAPASAPCGHTNTSPSPDSPHARVAAPRRWWLVVDRDGYPVYAYASQRVAVERVQEDNENVPRPAFTPYSVVPVVEARVTREQYDRVVRECFCSIPHYGIRAMLTALGLTVEE